ncbi:MAG: hypothetical protein ACI81P_002506 [Neolewinella sp.]|jgi:hypothetical protein
MGGMVVATDDLIKKHFISLFPNPTSSELTLRFEGASPAKGQVQLLDLYGRVVLQNPLVVGRQESTFNLETLPAGVYFVNVLEGGVT